MLEICSVARFQPPPRRAPRLRSMSGALTQKGGVLFVGSHARTARLRTHDLDGRRLAGGFTFRDSERERSSVEGIAVDEDRRLWVADGQGLSLRTFSLFGREIANVPAGKEDLAGQIGRPTGVSVTGTDDEFLVGVTSAGLRRHGAQILSPNSGRMVSLRPLGNPEGFFRDAQGIVLQDEEAWVLEARTPRLQVFKQGAFHYALPLPEIDGAWPQAFALAPGGRSVVAWGGESGAVLLLGPDGRVNGCLAAAGEEVGGVSHPTGILVVPGEDDRHTRVVLLDHGGSRVQVFNLEGTCYGAFVGSRLGGGEVESG